MDRDYFILNEPLPEPLMPSLAALTLTVTLPASKLGRHDALMKPLSSVSGMLTVSDAPLDCASARTVASPTDLPSRVTSTKITCSAPKNISLLLNVTFTVSVGTGVAVGTGVWVGRAVGVAVALENDDDEDEAEAELNEGEELDEDTRVLLPKGGVGTGVVATGTVNWPATQPVAPLGVFTFFQV